MKKVWALLAILTVLLIISFLPVQYLGWKTIRVDGVGSFRVPADWIYTVDDGLIYLTDRPVDESGCDVYLTEPVVSGGHVSNRLIGRAGYTKTTTYKTLSNSANYGQKFYNQNGNSFVRYFILFIGIDQGLLLIAWDDLVDEHVIKMIAESYNLEE